MLGMWDVFGAVDYRRFNRGNIQPLSAQEWVGGVAVGIDHCTCTAHGIGGGNPIFYLEIVACMFGQELVVPSDCPDQVTRGTLSAPATAGKKFKRRGR